MVAVIVKSGLRRITIPKITDKTPVIPIKILPGAAQVALKLAKNSKIPVIMAQKATM